MSKGKRGIGLAKPCPKCGSEVPSMYVSPVQPGLCGKCTDEILRQRAPKPTPVSTVKTSGLEKVGGGSTIIGFALGLGLGVLGSLALAVFAAGFWGNIVTGLKGIF